MAAYEVSKHYLDAEDSLSEQHVTASGVHVVVDGVSGMDHEAVNELHRLGPLSPQLAGHDHLATLSSGLHDEPQDSVARPTDGQASDQLVTKGLGLREVLAQ